MANPVAISWQFFENTPETWQSRGKICGKLREKVAMKQENLQQNVENMGKHRKKLLTPAGSRRVTRKPLGLPETQIF